MYPRILLIYCYTRYVLTKKKSPLYNTDPEKKFKIYIEDRNYSRYQ